MSKRELNQLILQTGLPIDNTYSKLFLVKKKESNDRIGDNWSFSLQLHTGNLAEIYDYFF